MNPEPDPLAAPAPTMVAVAALAVALLVGAVVLIRSAPTGSTDVVAGAVGPELVDPADPAGLAPVGPADLPHAGLVAARTDAMRAAVADAVTGPAVRSDPPPPGAFGPAPDHCAERNRLLPRDLSPITYRPRSDGCLVARGLLTDPYLGQTVRYDHDASDRVAVDHIVSLSYVWAHGAAGWTPAERRAFARDPLNLVVADARQVQAKAGRGPVGWLPPNVALRCAYVARFASVASRYGLTVTAADQEVARRQCAEA
jgi:hypothetical protein